LREIFRQTLPVDDHVCAVNANGPTPVVFLSLLHVNEVDMIALKRRDEVAPVEMPTSKQAVAAPRNFLHKHQAVANSPAHQRPASQRHGHWSVIA
jgi:hypothetical protein